MCFISILLYSIAKLQRYGTLKDGLNFILPVLWCRGCFDINEDEDNATTPDWKDANLINSGQQLLTKASIGSLAHTTNEEDTAAQNTSLPRQVISEQKKYLSGSIIPESTFSPKRNTSDADRLAFSTYFSVTIYLNMLYLLWSSCSMHLKMS